MKKPKPKSKAERIVQPLKKRTMTLTRLQLATLDLIRKVRFQLNRQAHEEGMSDGEFIEQVLDPLETTIYQDRHMKRMQEVGDKIRKSPLGTVPYDGVGKQTSLKEPTNAK